MTGEAPTVDVQNTSRQRIVDRDIIENIPAGRNIWALGALNPGITTNVPQDVGGEFRGGFVAPRAVLFERLHDDPVQVAADELAQFRRIGLAVRRDGGQRVTQGR